MCYDGTANIPSALQIGLCDFFFNCCTVHFDNVKIPFYQKMHLLLNI
jgi:hypothetical protein